MKIINYFVLCLCLCANNLYAQNELKKDGWYDLNKNGKKDVYENPEVNMNERVNNLLEMMTLEEKVGQMYQAMFSSRAAAEVGDAPKDSPDYFHKKGILGSVLGSKKAKDAFKAQTAILEKSRLGIPLTFHLDVIHGFETGFPVNIAMSGMWEPAEIERMASISAAEATAAGINFNHGPMMDVCRDPRWGRCTEGNGEDTYLCSEIAAAYVRGYQGNSLYDKNTIVACAKHFAGYGASEAGRDYNSTFFDERTLRELYLPPFQASINEGLESIMTSFNIINGIPSTGNSWLLKEIGREEMGFNGVYISDYGATEEMIEHAYVANLKDACEKSIKATVDIEMVSQSYVKYIPKLLEEGKLVMKDIDLCVSRILAMKFKLGIFDDPFRYIDVETSKSRILTKANRKAAREIAGKSMVLLENDTVPETGKPILPLNVNDYKNVALIGPFANTKNLLGAWSIGASPRYVVSVEKGMKAAFPEGCNINTVEACKETWGEKIEEEWDEAISLAKESDLVVLCLGESDRLSGEAASRARLDFPGAQKELAEEILALGKPVVLVVFSGRPLIMEWYKEHFPAIVYAWYPGTEAGNAVADVLTGKLNPSAKLTMSFPVCEGQIPVYYNYFNTGRPIKPGVQSKFRSRYLDIPNEPLYAFGYGLSYTNYEYSDFQINNNSLTKGGEITASVKVSNTGNFAGDEIVQWYIRDIAGSVVRPVKELKGFNKLHLNPGESKNVTFTINEDKLKFWNSEMQYEAEIGDFQIMVGTTSDKLEVLSFELR